MVPIAKRHNNVFVNACLNSPADCSRWRLLQILWFKDHIHFTGHLYDFTTHQTQLMKKDKVHELISILSNSPDTWISILCSSNFNHYMFQFDNKNCQPFCCHLARCSCFQFHTASTGPSKIIHFLSSLVFDANSRNVFASTPAKCISILFRTYPDNKYPSAEVCD